MLVHLRSSIRMLPFCLALSLLGACGGGGGSGSSSPVNQLLSIAVISSSGTVTSGNTLQLTATGTYSDSSSVNLTKTVTWSSANSIIASVDSSSGLVTAAGIGTGIITATVGSVSGSITLTVTPPTKGWSPAGNLVTPTSTGFTATLLGNGTVLVAGGCCTASGASANAEIYNPATRTWAATGVMATPRVKHSATLLRDGTVLVAGGENCPTDGCASVAPPLASAEIYNPTTGTWSATGSMLIHRYGFLATLLPNGTVLVVGGTTSSTATCGMTQCQTTAAEIYDPAAGTWTLTGPSLYAANYSQFNLPMLSSQGPLALGYVAVGNLGTPISEIYDITAGTWTSVAASSFDYGPNTVTLLSDGTVLAAGGIALAGQTYAIVNGAEIYTPSAATWAQTGSMSDARQSTTATLLTDGTVLVAGGQGCAAPSCLSSQSTTLNSSEIFHPSTGVWTPTGSMTSARAGHTATLLADGTVLVVGGTSYFDGTNYVVSTEIYYP